MTNPPEISWFSALCDDDYEFLGVPDPQLKSSWEHCRNIVMRAEEGGFDNILLPSGYELGLDTTAFAAAVATQVKRIKLLWATRMGEDWPPQLARRIATLDRILGPNAAGTGGRLRHLAYLLEAAHVARRSTALGATHLHAHFGTNSATVALLAHRLGAAGYSFTVHGPEEFDAPRAFSFPQKMHEARFTVAVSSFGRSQLLRWSAIADWPRIKVVHCGVDTTRFDPPAPMPQGGPHLVAIGRLSEQKGFPLLIETMAQACARLPDLRLTLCGDGDLRGLIDAEIARHGLQDRITITGWISEADIRAAIGSAHALILPSLAEGLPMVVMEGMACGRPIIATSIAGIPELVTPDTGWLVPAGDPTTLTEAIMTLAATPITTLQAMGEAARLRVFARHNIDVEAAKLAALFMHFQGM